jgi:hypothetical protein
MGRSHQLFQPVVFSQLFWVISFYQLIKYILLKKQKHLWYVTFSVAAAFLTKYDALFSMAGLGSLLVFAATRRQLMTDRFSRNIVVFLLLVAPNILWQHLHHWPVWKMFTVYTKPN